MRGNDIHGTISKIILTAMALSIGACSINAGCKTTKEVWKSDDMNLFEKILVTSRIWHR